MSDQDSMATIRTRWLRPSVLLAVALLTLGTGAPRGYAADPVVRDNPVLERAGAKLLRGAMNVLTGVAELPKQVYEV